MRQRGRRPAGIFPVGIVSGVVNQLAGSRKLGTEGAEFVVVFAAQVVKGEVAPPQRRTKIGLYRQGGGFQHGGQRRTAVLAS